jgi:hypothetical protein
MKRLLLIFAAALPIHAATTIEVSAKFADIPAGTVVTASTVKLEKMKGVNVLSAPKISTKSGEKATAEVTQSQSAPGGASVPLGLTLDITPTLGEKAINFSGKSTDRAMHGKRSDGGVSTVEFATREVYFSGSATSGETVLVHTAPAITRSSKGTETARELVILLTFNKKTTGEEPEKKPATKSTTTKKTSSGSDKKAEQKKTTSKAKVTPPTKKKR